MSKQAGRNKKKHKLKRRSPPTTNAYLGTAIIASLVQNSQTNEEDRPTIEAIRDSLWSYLASNYSPEQKAYWASAAILAAYNLGREGIKIPTNQIN